ncbi:MULTISPECIES: head-tail adaptor protein [unclassified Iodidimonas]|jgi:SPP1 family predicted phage head-tail adaptor|uniref:head-tail adaptor protein n=1 Tax=unclassified Iodidimonas TaxID=2626145 RepID=UPI00248259A5|nr:MULTISPECIES: head-tail adaptor protein [unclassified Iodidimonas]
MSPVIDAGRLDQRLDHERPVETLDENGLMQVIWQPLGRLWAAVKVQGGQAAREAERPTARLSYALTLRSGSDCIEGDRLHWKGRILDVVAVLAHGSDPRFIEILCSETRP